MGRSPTCAGRTHARTDHVLVIKHTSTDLQELKPSKARSLTITESEKSGQKADRKISRLLETNTLLNNLWAKEAIPKKGKIHMKLNKN